MKTEEIRAFAEKANKEGELALAGILYTYLGAKELHRENILLNYVTEFAENDINNIHYNNWLDEG